VLPLDSRVKRVGISNLELGWKITRLSNASANAMVLLIAQLVQLWLAHFRGNRSLSVGRKGLPVILSANLAESFACSFASFSTSGLKCVRAFLRSTSTFTS